MFVNRKRPATARLAIAATVVASVAGALLAPSTAAMAEEQPSKEQILAGVEQMLGFVPTFMQQMPRATLPVAIATVLDVQPTQALMWVPSMSQHLLILALIKQEAIVPLMAAQSAVSTLLYALLLALVTIRLYKREALLG